MLGVKGSGFRDVSYLLDSLKGLCRRLYRDPSIGLIKGNIRSLDYSNSSECKARGSGCWFW